MVEIFKFMYTITKKLCYIASEKNHLLKGQVSVVLSGTWGPTKHPRFLGFLSSNGQFLMQRYSVGKKHTNENFAEQKFVPSMKMLIYSAKR